MGNIKKLIPSNVHFVTNEDTIYSSVELMIEHKIGSVLVCDQDENVIGICTERDIVRKFTLLDIKDKLTKSIGSIMSMPVDFVRLDSLLDDIIALHAAKNFRHFPVISGDSKKRNDVVALISISDVFRQHFVVKDDDQQPVTLEVVANETRKLTVLAHPNNLNTGYISIFEKLGFDVGRIPDFNKFVRDNPNQECPIIFDMDLFKEKELKDNIIITRNYRGPLIMATSNPNLLALFNKFIGERHQHIALKPIDISYCHWFFTEKYKTVK